MKNFLEKNKKVLGIVSAAGAALVVLVIIIVLIVLSKNEDTNLQAQMDTSNMITTDKEEKTTPDEIIIETTTDKKEAEEKETEEITKEEIITTTENIQSTTVQQTTKQTVVQATTTAPTATTQPTKATALKISDYIAADPTFTTKPITDEYLDSLRALGFIVEYRIEHAELFTSYVPADVKAYVDNIAVKYLNDEITGKECYDKIYNYLYNYTPEGTYWYNETDGQYYDVSHWIQGTDGNWYDYYMTLGVAGYDGTSYFKYGSNEGWQYIYARDMSLYDGYNHWSLTKGDKGICF